jgi:uncharacterized protein with FMN-binding domain
MTQQPEKRVAAPPSRQSAPTAPAPRPSKAKGGNGKNKKIANGLVALSSAAILSVYGLGYVRTNAVQAIDNVDAPAISIATAAPTATNVAPSAAAAYQSPLFPLPTVATSAPESSMQGVATATTVPSPATTATPATSAPATATIVPPITTAVVKAPANAVPTSTAKAPAAATSAPASTALYKDGTYTGTGTSRHGNISASVVVQGGKIVSAAITQCGTRYPCSDIASLPGEVVTRQSAAVDVVSGATDSSQAYRGAIQNALAKAKGAA